MTIHSDEQQTKRQLRLQIGRLRRRIDRRVRGFGPGAVRLVAWRTYVHRYPALAMLLALVLGLAAAASVRPGNWAERFRFQGTPGRIGKALAVLWREIKGLWGAREPQDSKGPSEGDEHARS